MAEGSIDGGGLWRTTDRRAVRVGPERAKGQWEDVSTVWGRMLQEART